MRLTVLGCCGSMPGPDSPASGYLVRSGGSALGLDLGNGTLGAMLRHVDPADLDGLALSHLHPDHCADMAALVVYLRYRPQAGSASRRLPVYGPSETAARLATVYAPSAAEAAETDLSDVLDIRPLGRATAAGAATAATAAAAATAGAAGTATTAGTEAAGGTGDGTVHIGPFELTTARVAHPCEAYALRVRCGHHTLAYTGDSGPCEELSALVAGADLLLAEATWTDDPGRPADLHLSGTQAGRLAAEAGVGRLLLTHVAPWTDPSAVLAEARREFDGPVELVAADLSYDL